MHPQNLLQNLKHAKLDPLVWLEHNVNFLPVVSLLRSGEKKHIGDMRSWQTLGNEKSVTQALDYRNICIKYGHK